MTKSKRQAKNFDLQTLILLIKILEKIYPSVTIKSQAEASVVLNWKRITLIMSQKYLDLEMINAMASIGL